MKFSKVLKSASVLLMTCAAFTLMSCGDKDATKDPVETTYTLSVSSNYIDLDEGDDAGSITVTTNGTFEIEVESEAVATASVSDNTIAITPVAEGSTTVVVTCKEDPTKTAEIGVYVKSLYQLTLNIASDVAADAASISVYYEGKEDSETTASKTGTAVATYTAGATTATVGLKKSLANSYDYFNNIVITVKDDAGNVIDTAADVAYFCYTATEGDGYLANSTINISKAVSEKTFTIKFSGFTIQGGSVEGVKYSNLWSDANGAVDWSDSAVTTPTVTVSTDGTYATFNVTKASLTNKKEFFITWTAVTIKNSEGNEVTITSGLTDENKWYSYNATESSKWEITAVVVNTSGYTALGEKELTVENENSYTIVYSASELESITFTELKVTISSTASGAWASISGKDSWVADSYVSNCINKSTYITESTFIDAIKTNGLYIQSWEGIYTVSVEYK